MLLMFCLYSLLVYRDPKGKQAAAFLSMILNSLWFCPCARWDKKRRKDKSSENCSCWMLDGAVIAVTRLTYPSSSWSRQRVFNLSLPWQVCCSLEQPH